jgi:hypothetical protein
MFVKWCIRQEKIIRKASDRTGVNAFLILEKPERRKAKIRKCFLYL